MESLIWYVYLVIITQMGQNLCGDFVTCPININKVIERKKGDVT